MLRIDVRFLKPNNYSEVGLVDYAPGSSANTPTLFVGAYCKTRADDAWFEKQISDIIKRSGKPAKGKVRSKR